MVLLVNVFYETNVKSEFCGPARSCCLNKLGR